jgi:hypothetical protein
MHRTPVSISRKMSYTFSFREVPGVDVFEFAARPEVMS